MDDKSPDLARFRPLNLYGYSKHLFDLYAMREGILDDIVGIKYFNVFGPNEYHKGDMKPRLQSLRGNPKNRPHPAFQELQTRIPGWRSNA